MKRANLNESFHGEGDRAFDGLESAASTANEELIVEVRGGTLSFLTRAHETDENAIKKARFVRGELKMENGAVFIFWLNDQGRSGSLVGDMGVYASNKPQTG